MQELVSGLQWSGMSKLPEDNLPVDDEAKLGEEDTDDSWAVGVDSCALGADLWVVGVKERLEETTTVSSYMKK